ncbi:MAG: glutamate racemase [Prochlorotrichaceae cyanobacterium]
MLSQSSPIGIFDSGVGGLTVLKEVSRQLPQESIVYFGDTARLPYGDRSPAEILQYVREILNWMTTQGVKMVIMACNTSSALALDLVAKEYPFPILGVILPGARAAIQRGKRIGVLATPATASSHAYRHAILNLQPQAKVWEIGCPEFVPLIEGNCLADPETHNVVKLYMSLLLDQQIDTLIYGCTHYPHLHPLIQRIAPPTLQIINPASYVVEQARQDLDRLHALCQPNPSGLHLQQQTTFSVSGDPDRFAALATQWLGYQPTVQHLDISAYGTGLPPAARMSALESRGLEGKGLSAFNAEIQEAVA